MFDHGGGGLCFEFHGNSLGAAFRVAVGLAELGEGHVDFFVGNLVALREFQWSAVVVYSCGGGLGGVPREGVEIYPISDHLVHRSSDAPEAGGFSVDFAHGGEWYLINRNPTVAQMLEALVTHNCKARSRGALTRNRG